MSIDKHKEHLLDIMDSMPDDACGDWRDSLAYAIEVMRKYQQLQADYENRLKADLKAILVELQLEIQEFSGCSCTCSDGIVNDIDDLIQQKIDKLKGGAE